MLKGNIQKKIMPQKRKKKKKVNIPWVSQARMSRWPFTQQSFIWQGDLVGFQVPTAIDSCCRSLPQSLFYTHRWDCTFWQIKVIFFWESTNKSNINYSNPEFPYKHHPLFQSLCPLDDTVKIWHQGTSTLRVAKVKKKKKISFCLKALSGENPISTNIQLP